MDDLGNRWLQERIERSRNVPPEFHHYTSAQGLLGIIHSHNMCATDVRYSNDGDEIAHGQRLLTDLLATYRPTESAPARELLASIPRSLSQLFDLMEIYVTCMCTHLDLAAHWRGYSGRGDTYAITFDSQAAARGVAGQSLPLAREPVEVDPVINLAVRDEADAQAIWSRELEKVDGSIFTGEIVGDPVTVNQVPHSSTGGRDKILRLS
jgi:hypothetical protein